MRRREFLNSTVVAGAAALMTPAAALAEAATGAPVLRPSAPAGTPKSLSRTWFEGNLKSRFLIETDKGRRVEAVLVEVKDRGRTDRLDQFSVVFQTPDGAKASGLRWLTHAEGRFQLALEEPHHIGDAQMCEAHFSLLL
jgi:hypothetical protein